MSVIRNIYNGFGQFIAKMSRERRGLYWTKLMKDNVSMLERNGIGGVICRNYKLIAFVNCIRDYLDFLSFFTRSIQKQLGNFIPIIYQMRCITSMWIHITIIGKWQRI